MSGDIYFSGPVILNTLVESRKILEIRLYNQDKKESDTLINSSWKDVLEKFKKGGWKVINQEDVFNKNNQKGSPIDGILSDGIDDNLSKIKNLQFPKCECALVYPASGEQVRELFEQVVYHECNSVSEIHNRRTLFVVPKMTDGSIEYELDPKDLHIMEENKFDNFESDIKLSLVMLIGLEFENKQTGNSGRKVEIRERKKLKEKNLELHSVSVTLIVGPSGWTNLNSDRFSVNNFEIEDKLVEITRQLFHMRKIFLSSKLYHGSNSSRQGLEWSIIDAVESVREVAAGGRNNYKDGIVHFFKNKPHDLHDLQIEAILLIFSALSENFNHAELLYNDMRDDLRSDTFTSMVLTVSPEISDNSIVSILEGFDVKLKQDVFKNYRTLESYLVGYPDKETNIFLSWNDLLMLKEETYVKDFTTFGKAHIKSMLPRAFIVNLLAGELMNLNSLYNELLSRIDKDEDIKNIRKITRSIYLETALMFDLGYVQVPLIKKILERIVQQYGFKATLDGLRSTLSALDASVSAESAEKLNIIILLVGVAAIISSILLAKIPAFWPWLSSEILLVLILLIIYYLNQLIRK